MRIDTKYAYSEAEMHAYNEGFQARKDGVDYFDSPYMRQTPRNLYTLTAWTQGWLDAESEKAEAA